MSDIKQALEMLYRQKADIEKKIVALENADKIAGKIIKGEQVGNNSSLAQRILTIISENRAGLQTADVIKKVGGNIGTVRTTLSRLKNEGHLIYDDKTNSYKSLS